MLYMENGNIGIMFCDDRKTKIETVSAGFVNLKQKISLMPAVVVYPDSDGKFLCNDIVYFNGEVSKMPWAGRCYELYGKSFYIAPINQVLLKERPESQTSINTGSY